MTRFHFDIILQAPADIRRPLDEAAADTLEAAINALTANHKALCAERDNLKAGGDGTLSPEMRKSELRRLARSIRENEAARESLNQKFYGLPRYVDQDRAVAYLMEFLLRPQTALEQQRQAVIDRLLGNVSSDNLALALDGGMPDLVRIAVVAEECARIREYFQGALVEAGEAPIVAPLEALRPLVERLVSDRQETVVGMVSTDGSLRPGRAAKLAGHIDVLDLLTGILEQIDHWRKGKE